MPGDSGPLTMAIAGTLDVASRATKFWGARKDWIFQAEPEVRAGSCAWLQLLRQPCFFPQGVKNGSFKA